MPTDTKLNELIFNVLTEEQYKNITPNENEFYLTDDNSSSDNKTMVLVSENNSITLTKEQFDTLSNNSDYVIVVQDNNSDTTGRWLGLCDYDDDHGDLVIVVQSFSLEGFVKIVQLYSFTKDKLTSKYQSMFAAGIIPVTQYDVVFGAASSETNLQIPLTTIPSLSTTLSTQESDFPTITLTDDDIAMIKGKENGLLYANVNFGGLITSKNLFGVTLLQQDTYLLSYVTGRLGTLLAFDGGAPAAVSFVIDISTKHITQFGKVLALTNASSLIITKSNKIYLSSGVQEEGLDPDPLNKQYYIDTINGQSIFHENQSEAKDHAIPTIDDAISETSTNPVQNKVIKAYVDSLILTTINGSY